MKRSSQSHMSVHTPPIGSVHLRPATRSCIARACRGARACFSPRSQRSCAAILLPRRSGRADQFEDGRKMGHTSCFGCGVEGGHEPVICKIAELWLGAAREGRRNDPVDQGQHPDMPKVLEQHRKGRGMQVRSLNPHICAIFYFILLMFRLSLCSRMSVDIANTSSAGCA